MSHTSDELDNMGDSWAELQELLKEVNRQARQTDARDAYVSWQVVVENPAVKAAGR